MAKIDNYSRKETGLGEAQQKSQHIELILRLYETHQYRDDAPGDHDAGNPAARAPLLDQNASRNLEQEVAEEKDAGAEPQDLISERQVTFHLQRGITHVDPIEISNDKEDEKIGHQSPHDSAARTKRYRSEIKLHNISLLPLEK